MHVKRNAAVAATVVAAVAGAGGGAYAASQGSSTTTNPRQAFLNDVAGRLGVAPAKLTEAVKAAALDQLNAAVKAGRLTQKQADAIAQRIQQGELGRRWLPFAGPPPAGGPRGLGGPAGPARRAGGAASLRAAANYLGLTPAQLSTQLKSGKTLAQVAQSRGKSTDGLKQAIVNAEKAELDQAVKSGRITAAQEQQILSTLSARVANKINRAHAGFRGHWGFRPGGPPPGLFGGPGPGAAGAPPAGAPPAGGPPSQTP